MAIKPKKVISSRGEPGVGGGSRGVSGGRESYVVPAPKILRAKPVKRVAVRKNAPVKIKSGGDIKPATDKKTIANHPALVGRAPSLDRVKLDLANAKLYTTKGKTIKINSAPRRTSGNK